MNGSTATTEYIYDANGNLTKDLNKGISSITYNSLNLPQVITFTDGSTITYTYTADGTKLRVVHVISGTTTQTDYCGNVIYESGAQKYLLNEVGYYNLASSVYCYYLKDHQGNNRVVINSSGTVQETNHYYPFGGLFASSTTQPFKYNGKEFDNKKGLNWYDYGARHYDVALGRWHTVDPLTDKYYGNSPYTYCVNSPLLLIDPDGESPKLIKLVYNVAKGTYKTY
ncbi:MAG: RHS repeat-associated core domain-containing protein, partial [Bacteroides sp.]|nr:RHS repeat-associated core domain-containing protein [Bacteroides sp.]